MEGRGSSAFFFFPLTQRAAAAARTEHRRGKAASSARPFGRIFNKNIPLRTGRSVFFLFLSAPTPAAGIGRRKTGVNFLRRYPIRFMRMKTASTGTASKIRRRKMRTMRTAESHSKNSFPFRMYYRLCSIWKKWESEQRKTLFLIVDML